MSTRIRLRRNDGRVFLERWGLECRLGGIFIHKMSAPDPGVDLHSHPWLFWSFILRGGYTEERCAVSVASGVARRAEDKGRPHRGAIERRRLGSWRKFPLEQCHRIIELRRKTSWSLVIHGPKVEKPWGFYLPTGFIASEEYFNGVTGQRRQLVDEFANNAQGV